VASGGQDDDSDTEMVVPQSQPQERTRQKKFSKYFKDLQGEVATVRISCAYVGDILLHGHLYVTDNYLAFHSNVFGYVTRIQVAMTSVTKITKEKTAKIIPNAIAVSTDSEKHIFTSFISRDQTYNLMITAWRKALTRNNIHDLDICGDNVDGGNDRQYETSDSEDSTNHEMAFSSQSHHRRHSKNNSSKLLSSNSLLANNRNKIKSTSPSLSLWSSLFKTSANLSMSYLLLLFLIALLVLLLLSSLCLVLKLDNIHDRMDLPTNQQQENSNPDILNNLHNLLNSRSNKKVQEYLTDNLEQIGKIRDNLQKLSSFLASGTKIASTDIDQ